jgi:teichoic acid transport system permease protein
MDAIVAPAIPGIPAQRSEHRDMAEATLSEQRSTVNAKELAARYGLHVAAERPSIPKYLRQLWAYRHFIAAYSNAKTASQFANVGLGQLWQVLTPLANAAVYYLIFGLVLNTKRGVDDFIGYLTIGIFIYTFTATVVQNSVATITANLGMIRALHFPRATLPLTVTFQQAQQMGASVLVLLVILVLQHEPITLKWLLLVPALFLQMLFNAGCAMLMARLGSKITDLKQLVPFFMRTWLYGSGVFYSITIFTQHLSGIWQKIFLLNPLLVFASLPRELLMKNPPAHPMSEPKQWLVALIWALIALVVGFVYFWRGEKEYGRG